MVIIIIKEVKCKQTINWLIVTTAHSSATAIYPPTEQVNYEPHWMDYSNEDHAADDDDPQ